MHISYKPLWHTLLERDEKRGFKACRWYDNKYDCQHEQEGKHISMDTLARIWKTLNCGDYRCVIELVPDEPASTGVGT